MFKKLMLVAALALSCAVSAVAQNANSSSTAAPQTPARRPTTRRPAPLPSPTPSGGAQKVLPGTVDAPDALDQPATRTRAAEPAADA